MKRIHGVIHINRIELDAIHRLTLKILNQQGFIGNWIKTSSIPEIQVFKADVEDSNYIEVTINPNLLDIYTSFQGVKLNSEEGEELRATFNPAMAIIGKIYHNGSKGLDLTDDYTIAPA